MNLRRPVPSSVVFVLILVASALVLEGRAATRATPSMQGGTEHRVAVDLQTWANVMEMFRLDDGEYPTAESITDLAAMVRARGYWDDPAVSDRSGRAYVVTSVPTEFRIKAVSGHGVTASFNPSSGNAATAALPDRRPSGESAYGKPQTVGRTPAPSVDPRSPDTVLTVGKAGNDVVLSWTGPGTIYDAARATDGPFANATTLFTGLVGATTHTYVGAVANARMLEFFDVTDETESNRGGNWNGGVLPPPPPAIDTASPSTTIGNLFIGSTGTIAGSGFSAVPAGNTVCFNGGVCTQATTGSPTQIEFVTPSGALTGSVTVTAGEQTSEPKNANVRLEDPATGWLIRTIGFSREDKSYWMAGSSAAVNSLYRVRYDSGTGKWARDDRGGASSGTLLFCSTKTSRTGRIFCGLGTAATGGGTTRVGETNPPVNLANCINLGGGTDSSNVRGAAVDPNPNGVAGRDVVYFAHAVDSLTPSYVVKKVASDCSSILDANYGNTNWSGNWNSIVGMAVDPVNGDLYIAAITNIQRIATNESVQVVKGGFTSVNGIDISRQGASDPGLLLIADGGTSNTVKALALDNTGAQPLSVASASVLRAASFGASVSGGPWLATNVNRTVVIHNNGNSGAVDPVRPHPLLKVTSAGPFKVRISSPSAAEQFPPGQSTMRPSTYQDPTRSQAFTELQYADGLSRITCAWAGDPGEGAPQYDAAPATPANCNKPRTTALGPCDNRDDIVIGGAGSFAESGNPIHSCKTCGSASSPCRWEFRITNRYGGDNYKVHFAFEQNSTEFALATDIYTAWKHVHAERERMCNVGGVLFEDYGATGQCGGIGQPACCGTGGQAPCDQIVVYDPSNIVMGQELVVFDEVNTYEAAGYTRTVTAPPTNNGDGTITITLDSPLPKSYWSSDEDPLGSPKVPDFRNGHSGGACVPSAGFVEADLSDLRQSLSDALVGYHIPTYGLDGSGVVPRLWPAFFDFDPWMPAQSGDVPTLLLIPPLRTMSFT
jgi:hypothetical protein